MRGRAAALAIAAAAALPATASANVQFSGTTDQGRPIELEVADNGLMRFIDVSWRTLRCSKSRKRLTEVSTLREFDRTTTSAFLFDHPFGRRRAGGIRIAVDMTMIGNRTADPANPSLARWSGTMELFAVVRKRGRVIDRCRLPEIGWSATEEPVT